jgi:Tol biopolymer transport system component/tRNA A-37 threonylcarbamoyl transferase component Bud32
MTLAAGSRLGPYEIVAPIGAGGMGEVYRARDPKLGREVALKVLPAEVATDRDRLARFEQEARAASALNHPNIVTIYEVGSAGPVAYIAMELVSGKTMRDLLTDGPPPLKRFLALSVQIAEGLDRAHQAGIVHRDLKPENLMVTREGFVKILDFGLAKLVGTPESDISQLATSGEPTRPGIVLGTVGYMSPEQATGRPLDFRSDQFSLGSILYEMATGKRAFSRESVAETLTAIIREEPESLQSLAPQLPVALRWVIERCLAKEPEERYASTRDLARDLKHMRDHASEVSAEAVPVILARRLGWLGPALMAGLLVAAALAVFAVLRGRDRLPVRPVRFSVSIPAGATYSPGEISRGFAHSPDGTRLVIEAVVRGRRRLFLRPLDSDNATEIDGTNGAEAPFWSPDSRFIAFFADGKLKKIPAAGGSPEELCAASFDIVGSWNREGTILFSEISLRRGIVRVSDKGGEAVPATVVDSSRDVVADLWPHFLPDGRRFLYLASHPTAPGHGPRELRVGSLESPVSRAVTRLDSMAEYASPGYLLYVRDGTVFAQPFDEANARLTGEPLLVAENVHYFFGPGHASFSVSQTGVLAFQSAAPLSRLVWLDRAGKEIGTLGTPAVLTGFRISPDGGRAAVAIEDRRIGTSDVWVFELARGISTRLHSDPVDEKHPVWSADGSKVVYRSDRKGPPDIYEITPGAPGSEREVLALPGVQDPEDVSRDGRFLMYLNDTQMAASDVWLLPLFGDRKPVPWLKTRFAVTSPRFSPDGRWIAYESDESGDPEVYVARTEGAGEKQRLSTAGGRLPRWRRDGKELDYVTPDGFLMAVPISFGTRLEAGTPVQLFHAEAVIENYDVTPDGSRFLVSTPSEKVRESPIRVIVNWPATLKGEK